MRNTERVTTDAAAPRRYEPPRLERFGTFREITRQGFGAVDDGGFIIGDDGSTTPAGDEMVSRGSR